MIHPSRERFDLDLRRGVEIEDKVLALILGQSRIEVKYQPTARTHLFIETSYRGEPSGLATTEAEWWFLVYASGRQLLALETDVLIRIVYDYDLRSGGDAGQSRGYSVPISELAKPRG